MQADRTETTPVVVLTRTQRDALWGEVADGLEFHEPRLDLRQTETEVQDSRRQLEAVIALLDEIGWKEEGSRDPYDVTVSNALVPLVVSYRRLAKEGVSAHVDAGPSDDPDLAKSLAVCRSLLGACDLILDRADTEAVAR